MLEQSQDMAATYKTQSLALALRFTMTSWILRRRAVVVVLETACGKWRRMHASKGCGTEPPQRAVGDEVRHKGGMEDLDD